MCFRPYRCSWASCAAAEVAFGRSSMAGSACRGSNTIMLQHSLAPTLSCSNTVMLQHYHAPTLSCSNTINTIMAPLGSTTLMVLLTRWSMDCTTCRGATTLMALRALVKENCCCMKMKSKGTSSAKTHRERLGCMPYEEEDTCLLTRPPSGPGSAAELFNSGSNTVGVNFA